MSAPAPLVYRPLRRTDRRGYVEVILQGLGKLETSTGIGESAEDQIRALFGRPLWFLTRLARAVGRPLVDTFVAADGDRIAGTGMLLYGRRSAYVAGMATRPEYRGRGIATEILVRLGAQARRHHRTWLALDVESENETAIRVYRRSGYQEVARFSWFARPGAPPVLGPVPPTVRPLERSDVPLVTSRLDAARSEAYRTVFPSIARSLDHNETFGRSPSSRRGTWVGRTADGNVVVVRAYYLPKRKLGAVFVMSGAPEPGVEEYAAVLGAAAAWLAPLGPARCFAVAPLPAQSARAALEQAGFPLVVETITMVRETPT